MSFRFGLGCACCPGDDEPCDAIINVDVWCPENEVHVDVIGATIISGDIDPALPYSDNHATFLNVEIPYSAAEVTVIVSGVGLNTYSETVTINCDDVVTILAVNTPTTIAATSRVVTVDGRNGTYCPMEGASVEHTGCCTGTTGLTDADGYITLTLTQCAGLGTPSYVSVTPGEGYGAESDTVGGPCPTCGDTGPQIIPLYPDMDHIGHGTYGPNEMLAGFLCSGRYLPYQVPYEDDDGGCTLTFMSLDDLPPVLLGCVGGGLPAWFWFGAFEFAPARIGDDVSCEGGDPLCIASDNPTDKMVITYVFAWAIGDCDGVTIHVHRCTQVALAPTDCSFLDQECVYVTEGTTCGSLGYAVENLDGSAATTCPSGSLSASGTLSATGSWCDTGRSVDWSITTVI